ncbi:Chaperone protein dnaJ 49 [Vitis vinifera]|uniref:Chaperone protein dnaJ 49 n=1 Tax=Vitis vinifera TaxID=29760 RepID=A0A438IRG0_VITVI|nr:Chaperone protein dnaJ 49 [Vitis vinifera]
MVALRFKFIKWLCCDITQRKQLIREMECNKDEATRAKEIAEKKFIARDIAGAKKLALKAQNLFPGLDGLPQMLATLDVHISAENKINGEADWYGILGVNPQADDDTVRKQYRKLALMLHPDKNKSIGADGAFKLISEAWSLLSDKTKRIAYDQKRNVKAGQQKVQPPSGGPSSSAAANGFYSFTKSRTTNTKAHKNTTRMGPSSAPASAHKPKPNTFWTVCHRCKMQYEYLRIYLNHNLLCPNCHEPFFAVETPPPPSNGSKSSNPQWTFPQQQQSSNHQAASKSTLNQGKKNATSSNVGAGGFNAPDSFNHTNFQWGPFSRTSCASNAAQAASVVQKAYANVKREREEAQAASKREEALRRKHHASKKMSGVSSAGMSNSAKRRRGMDDVGASSYGKDITNRMGPGTGGAGATGLQGNLETRAVNGINKPNSSREVSHTEMQNILVEKARKEIRNKLNEWNSATVTKTAVKGVENGNEKANEKEEKIEKPLANGNVQDQNRPGESANTKTGVHAFKSFPDTCGGNTDIETIEPMSINVPDPDFHDFDKDRTERCFGDNQVWAAYDDDDGMPRYYAMIHSVISVNPFKMQLADMKSITLLILSHTRNWSPDWNELTADEVIHKYDMVEVLEDYDEELGVTVTPLVKVAGFKTVFHRHLDPREVRRIPREEMFRFSHHVPSYLLTGQEAPSAPKGCRELDPAATPLELLQVITDVREEEIVENDKIREENIVNKTTKANEKEIEENSEKATEKEISGDSKDMQEVEILEDAKESKTRKWSMLKKSQLAEFGLFVLMQIQFLELVV